MKRYLRPAVSLLVLVPMMLIGQRAQEVPLKNWPTAQFWQPSQAEREAAAKVAPQLQFSANAVSNTALIFVAITPCRLVDTRGPSAGFNGIAPFSGPSINAGTTLTIPVQSTAESSVDTEPAPCGVIPTIAQAYSFNLTVVPHASGAVDYVTLWPSGVTQPFVATVNDPQGAIVANAAIVPAGTPTGGINVFNDGPSTTDVIIDMNGYFAAPTDVNSNTAIGSGTLASNTTGGSNTASGADALQNNTTGSLNTASGFAALGGNTSGYGNTADGANTLQSNSSGGNNTAVGLSALFGNTTGGENTAGGANTLQSNTTGNNNTATGAAALESNTVGMNNTASGYLALQQNIGGSSNTAMGAYALEYANAGANTAIGFEALQDNTTGSQNTATGLGALLSNTTGGNNTANGNTTLLSNTTGGGNTAIGYAALRSNIGGPDFQGSNNTASGLFALTDNTTGSNNTANGIGALENLTTGSNNIAIGSDASINLAGNDSNNIHIGNGGISTDNGTIRIGTLGTQTSAYIAGIFGGSPGTPNFLVCVDGNGTLGTSGCANTPSSLRFKEQIADMGNSSSKLLQLRPVTFFYKPQYDDGAHALQYGLIAEEVAKVYPEMVGYDKDGRPASVKYQELAPMLVNELQKQNAQLQNQVQLQQEENRKLEGRLAALEALIAGRTSTAAPADGNR